MRITSALSIVVLGAFAAGAANGPVPWTEAHRHVGRIVVVEGDVRAVERAGRRLTLVFDPEDPRALRVTLLIPMITDLPVEPEALYRDRTVRVHGRVTRTAGHLDLIVTDPDRIAVVGFGAGDPGPPDPEVPAAVDRPAGPAVPRDVPAPPSPVAGAARRNEASCERLDASREAARRDALGAVGALRACLEAGRTGCPAVADAIAPPLARLEWLEQQRRAHCLPAP